jgi:hypothetical protein
MHQRRQVLTGSLQHIDEVVLRVGVVHPTGRQQALHNAGTPGSFLAIGMTRRARSMRFVSHDTSESSRSNGRFWPALAS